MICLNSRTFPPSFIRNLLEISQSQYIQRYYLNLLHTHAICKWSIKFVKHLLKAFDYIDYNIDDLRPSAEIDAHSPQSQIEVHWYLQTLLKFKCVKRKNVLCPAHHVLNKNCHCQQVGWGSFGLEARISG